MTPNLATRISALMGLLAVALGAFGAHGLKEILSRNETTVIWERALFFHFIHAVMLFVLAQRQPVSRLPWLSFLAGILCFSGSLYAFALMKTHWLVFITPLGGVSFMVGWVCLFVTAGRNCE